MFAQLLQGLGDYQQWSLLVLRLVVAAVLLVHGLPKIKHLSQTAQNFTAMGFWPGAFWGTVVACVEALGGFAILLGFLTQFVAAFFAVEMLVATAWKIRRGQGFVGGYEFDLLLIAAALVLATQGSGAFSLDMYYLGY